MNDKDKSCIKFGQFINENYTTHGQYWTPHIYEELFLRTDELYLFYQFLNENYYWKKEPGYWYHKNTDLGLAFTLKEIYKLYKP